MAVKALVITRDLPWPQTEGALQYSAQLLRTLTQIFDRVDVLSHGDSSQCSTKRYPDIPDNAVFNCYPTPSESVVRQTLSLRPAGCTRKYSPAARRMLAQLLVDRPQLVVIDHLHSAWAVPSLRQWKRRQCDLFVLYVTHNEEFSTRLSIAMSEVRNPVKSAAHFLEAMRIYFTDRRATKFVDAMTCISRNDQILHQRYYGCESTILLPAYQGNVVKTRYLHENLERKACVLGSFSWAAKKRNLELFLQTGYEGFRRHGIELSVIGKIEPDFLRHLKRRWTGVQFTGLVKEVEPYLKRCRIGVIPELAGGGFKLKSLEYVFNRLPVYALDHAVVELPLENGVSAALFKDMRELCEGIIRDIDKLDVLNQYQERAFAACKTFRGMDTGIRAIREALNSGGTTVSS